MGPHSLKKFAHFLPINAKSFLSCSGFSRKKLICEDSTSLVVDVGAEVGGGGGGGGGRGGRRPPCIMIGNRASGLLAMF